MYFGENIPINNNSSTWNKAILTHTKTQELAVFYMTGRSKNHDVSSSQAHTRHIISMQC